MPLECTDENKMLVYKGDPEVINWLLEQADKILESGLKEEEEAKANL